VLSAVVRLLTPGERALALPTMRWRGWFTVAARPRPPALLAGWPPCRPGCMGGLLLLPLRSSQRVALRKPCELRLRGIRRHPKSGVAVQFRVQTSHAFFIRMTPYRRGRQAAPWVLLLQSRPVLRRGRCHPGVRRRVPRLVIRRRSHQQLAHGHRHRLALPVRQLARRFRLPDRALGRPGCSRRGASSRARTNHRPWLRHRRLSWPARRRTRRQSH
jgi:hypothetical protein